MESSKINIEKKNTMQWDKGIFLITGDSLLSGLQERKMGSKVKVRSFPGARIKDFYSYLLPLLENILVISY